MDCIYHAWVRHVQWLDIKPSKLAYRLFRLLYELGGNRSGMYGGCVPLTIQMLNLTSGLQIRHIQHHPFFDKAAFIAGSETLGQQVMSRWSGFGERGISIAPAIYLLIGSHHAIFSTEKPTDRLSVLAIQLERREVHDRARSTASSVGL